MENTSVKRSMGSQSIIHVLDDDNIISVNPDGNCLFRAITIYLNNDLFSCRRNRSGVPSNRSLQNKEVTLSNSMRFFIVNYIERSKEHYKNPIDFDNEYYDSIDDRINEMYKTGEYGGMLEIKIASKLFKIPINIYIENDNNINLVSHFGHKYTENNIHCNLLLDDGHYMLLKNIPDIDISTPTPTPTPICTSTHESTKSVKYYFPKFNSNDVKCMPFSCKTIDTTVRHGVYVLDKNKTYSKELKKLSTGSNVKYGKMIDNGWFFWDNLDQLKKWANSNSFLWLI